MAVVDRTWLRLQAGLPLPLFERDFPGAAKAAFAFLDGLGFVLTAADAWDLSDDAITICWERADAE